MSDRYRDHDREDDHEGSTGACDDAVDIESLRRRYLIALADFRLDRASWLWPCVAAAVDSVFLIGDPIDAAGFCGDDDAAHVYDNVAARVWNDLCNRLLATVGEVDGWISITLEGVHEVLGSNLLLEYDDSAVDEDTLVTDAEFADIIGTEFGVSVPTLSRRETESGSPAVVGSNSGVHIDWARVSQMAGWLHSRIGTLPWRWQMDDNE